MAKPGLVWGKGKSPDDLAVRVSTLRDELSGNVERLMRQFLQEAVDEMRQRINTSGISHGVATGGARRVTDTMYDNVDFVLNYTGAGRVGGEFGWVKKQLDYFAYQEYGTEGGQGNGRGIREMLALTDAYQNFVRKMQDAFDNGRVTNLKQGRYA